MSKQTTALFRIERAVKKRGFNFVAGVDEVGRGSLAGPVVAAACIIPKGIVIEGVNDSKQLTPGKRELLYAELVKKVPYALGIIDEKKIDEINIYYASLLAMHNAVMALSPTPDYLLIDGVDLKSPQIPYQKVVGGDAKSYCIAAASIIAKVTRDRIMQEYHTQWSAYGFDKHKGYSTKQHLKAIAENGLSPIHRLSFQIKLPLIYKHIK